MVFVETLGNGKQYENTRLSTLKFLKILKKVNSFFTDLIIFFFFKKRRLDRRMFFKSLQFPKVSSKNIYYC